MRPAFVSLCVLAICAAPAAAQDRQLADSPLIRALQGCQAIADSAARLSCFDQASAAMVDAATRGDVAVVDREQVRKVRRSLFGFSLPPLPFFGGGKDEPENRQPKEFESTLTSFASAGNGRYRFSLEDGDAVWETTESAQLSDPRIGSKVVIESGVLGSYFARIDGQRWVRARRVR